MNDVDIVMVARSWIGTRFHHQGRQKKTEKHKGGVDCLGLLVGVAGELGLHLSDGTPLASFDSTNYSHYPNTTELMHKLARLLDPIPTEETLAGDVLLLRIDESPQHLAIVSNYQSGLGMIHAYAPARAVVEHSLDTWWMKRIKAAYRIKL
ncbi:MAG: C40 family peptidase [Rickettsiales bacterium]